MDYFLDFWLGKWQIVAVTVDGTKSVGYEEQVIAEFADENLAQQNWDMVMDSIAMGRFNETEEQMWERRRRIAARMEGVDA